MRKMRLVWYEKGGFVVVYNNLKYFIKSISYNKYKIQIYYTKQLILALFERDKK